MIAHSFLGLFSDPDPALCVKYHESDPASKIIPVQHLLGSAAATPAHNFLDTLSAVALAQEDGLS
jgi:hypothetical protein